MEEGSLTKIVIGLLFGFGVIALARLMRGKPPKNDEQKKEIYEKEKRNRLKDI